MILVETLPLFSTLLSRFRSNSVYEIYMHFSSLDVSFVKVGTETLGMCWTDV